MKTFSALDIRARLERAVRVAARLADAQYQLSALALQSDETASINLGARRVPLSRRVLGKSVPDLDASVEALRVAALANQAEAVIALRSELEGILHGVAVDVGVRL